jgi:hypothetical protein
VPALRPGVSGTEDGCRGLYLVDSLAARWGFEQDGHHTTTWFELRRPGVLGRCASSALGPQQGGRDGSGCYRGWPEGEQHPGGNEPGDTEGKRSHRD